MSVTQLIIGSHEKTIVIHESKSITYYFCKWALISVQYIHACNMQQESNSLNIKIYKYFNYLFMYVFFTVYLNSSKDKKTAKLVK